MGCSTLPIRSRNRLLRESSHSRQRAHLHPLRPRPSMIPNLPEDFPYILVVARNLVRNAPSQHLFTRDVLESAANLAWVTLAESWESSGRPCSWGAFRGRRSRWMIQKILQGEGLLLRPSRQTPLTAAALEIPEEFLAEVPDSRSDGVLDPRDIPGILEVEAQILDLRYLQGKTRDQTLAILGITRYQYNIHHLEACRKAKTLDENPN